MNRLPPLNILAWRFFTGNHLDGRRRTNATWIHEGTAPRYRCNWWNRKPRLYRIFWRMGVLLGIGVEVVFYVATPPFLFVLTHCIIVPILGASLRRRVKEERRLIRKVNTNLGDKAPDHVERELIDEIGVDAIPEDTSNVRNIRKGRKRA